MSRFRGRKSPSLDMKYLDKLNNWFSGWGRKGDGEGDERVEHGTVKEAAE